MKIVFRRLAGLTVNLIGWFSRPTPIERSPQERKFLAGEIRRLRVYDYPGCPSSLRVRQALLRLNLDIQYCDIRKCQIHRDNLLAEFGRVHAPCLRIEEGPGVRWLGDSTQIVDYLNQRFDPANSQQARVA
jgi:glutaredoxin